MFLDGAPDSCQSFGDFESLQNLLCSQDYNNDGQGGEQGTDTDNGEITDATTEPLEPLEEGKYISSLVSEYSTGTIFPNECRSDVLYHA